MATKDKQPDVKIYLRSDRPPEEPTEPLKEEAQFPMVVGDAMDFVSDQDTAVRRYEMNEFSETGQSSLLEMNEDGDIESMVKPIIEGEEPVMMKKDERGMPLNPTMGMIMEHFADLSMKVQKDPSITGQMKNIVSIPGQAIENAVGSTLKFFIKNTPDDFQNKFYDLGLDMERLGLVEKEGQFLGGLPGIFGSSQDFRERQFFSPEENAWWEDIGVGFAQFYTGLKGVQMIANTKKLLAPSMAADALVFDPTDGGLFSMINQLDLDPGAIQDFVEFMDSTQHDQNMGRAIQVAEGLMIGGILGGAGLAIQNKEPIKQFIKKVFTPESYGRKAADPAIRKVAELLTEVKSKWPKNQKFEKYMDKFGRGWRKNMGNERGAIMDPLVSKRRAISGQLIFPESGKTYPKNLIKIRDADGKERVIKDYEWLPDSDAPNFGIPPQPQTLPDGHPLLQETYLINTPAREKIRNKIVRDMVKGSKVIKGRQPDAFIKAGGASSGKGAVDAQMRKDGDIKPGVVEINADDIKEMLPEYNQFKKLNDSRWAAVLHEESAILADRVKDALIAKNRDVVFDRVLPNPEKAQALFEELKAAGYKIHLIGVTINPAEAVVRSMTRFNQNNRWVPPKTLLAGHKRVSENFEQYASQVDEVLLFQNRLKPQIIARKKEGQELVKLDETLYTEFVAKGNINVEANTLKEILPDPEGSTLTRPFGRTSATSGPMGSRPGSYQEGTGGTPPVPGRERLAGALAKPLNTDTKKFKKWFKDSKVVDEQGKPLVVYHGSIKKGLLKFDPKQTVEVEDAFFFSNSESVASEYQYERAYGDIIGDEPGDLVETYLSLQNPFAYQPKGKIVDAVEMGRVVKQAKKDGHDGIIIKNIDDTVGATGELSDIYVAFKPTQIKSKFNPGTFDPANPNIMAGALAVPAVYDPDQEPEFQQAGLFGPGILKGLGKLFKSDPPPGRTVAPDKPRPAYGKATELYIRDTNLKDKPLDLPPDTAEFLSRQDDIDYKNVDLYGKHERVNFGTIENSGQFGEDFRKFLVRALDLEDSVPETITFDEIIAKAEKLKWGSKDVMKLKPEDWDNSAGMLKVKDVWLQTAAYAHKMTKLAAEGDPSITDEMFMTAIQNFGIVNKQKEGLQASIARTLTAQRIKRPGVETESIEDFAKTMMTEAPEIPGNLTAQQFAKTLLIAGDDAPAQAWGELAEEIPGMREVFFSHFYPFMLSSFRTHAANFLSNGFVTADYIGTQGFAAMASPVRRNVLSRMPFINRIFKDTEDRKTAKEFLHTLQVLKQLLPESFVVARKAYNAPNQLDMGKMERKKMASEIVNAESMQQFFQNLHNNPKLKDKYIQRFIFPKDLKQGGAIARGIDWWGKKLDYPGKLLHSADEFAKTYSKGLGELDYAYRRAGMLLEEGVITREKHMETVQEVLKARSPKMIEAGETLAEFQTFQNALGDVGKWLQEGREKLSNLGWGIPWAHMILAFVKTPINVQKYNFHLMNLTKKSRDDIMGKNGGAKQDEALGRWGVASMYVTSATGLATNFFSDDVTLHGFGKYGVAIDVEGKENQRAQRMVEMNAGIKPCSIGIRDNKGAIHSYSFNTIEPLATYFCATADLAQNWHELVADLGEGELNKVRATLYEVMANNLINKNFAKNFHEFMTTVMDPNSVSGSPKYVDNIVTMVIPRIVKDLNTSLSETQHREFQHSMDGFMGMWEVMASNIPGLSKQLGPRVNYWNEPIYNYGSWGPDFLSPFRYSKTTPDAVDNEMYRLLMPMRDLPRKLEGVKMHPRVRLHWYYLMNNYESRGSNPLKMKQAVAQLISPKNSRYHGDMDDKYPGDPTGADMERIVLIKNILGTYKTEAKNKLLAGFHNNDIAKMDPIVMKYQPDLFDRIRAKKAQKKDTRGPLEADDMNMRSEWEWRDYYKKAQQQPPLGFK